MAARTYLKLRPAVNLVVLDSDSTVGGVWSKKRLYPNLIAQVKLGLFNYTDMAMPGTSQDNEVTGAMIHEYLKRYAEDHDIIRRIRFNTFVERAAKTDQGWRLSLRDLQSTVSFIDTAKLMVCTGVTSIPSMPTVKTLESSIPIIHSRDLGVKFHDLGQDKVQTVVVVGAAKSAYDAVYLILSMGKRVIWLIRPTGAGPLAILPSKLLGLSSIAVASTRLMTYLSPSILNTEGLLYRFFQRTVIGRWCTGKIWDVIAYLSDLHAGYSKDDHVRQLRPEVDRQRLEHSTLPLSVNANRDSIFWANSGLGVVTLPDFWSKIHAGDVQVIRDSIELIKHDSIILESSATFAADYIVMCTGWGDHFSMFDAETKAELGIPTLGERHSKDEPTVDVEWEKYDLEADQTVNEKLPFLASPPQWTGWQTNHDQARKRWRLYRRTIPLSLAEKGDRSLAIMGQIHTIQTPLVSEVQSFWSILYLLGELDVPDSDTMAQEIAEWNAWTRKRYLSQGQKFPYSLYDFLPVSMP